MCNSELLPINVNLYIAHLSFRLPTQPRLLWIDENPNANPRFIHTRTWTSLDMLDYGNSLDLAVSSWVY